MPAAVATIADDDSAAGLTRYPGGKNGMGIWQRIINQMPPHLIYIEAFLGSGALLRRKRPAPAGNIGIDVDAGIIARHSAGLRRDCTFVSADSLGWLRAYRGDARTLIYCDPPYLGEARCRPGRAIYRSEMQGRQEHAELLRILTSSPAMVMISGYSNPLYDTALYDWRRVEYQAMTRGGPKTEVLWMNFAEPRELHDYRFLGDDFHERCRISRKIARWQRRLAAMPDLERSAVLAGINVTRAEDNC